MLQSVKGRTLELGQVVEVYYNLHKNCYSIRDKKSGLVVAHADTVALINVTTKVSEVRRQRVLSEKKKNVHALIVGQFATASKSLNDEEKARLKSLYYNPYKADKFVDKVTMKEVKDASYVHCQDKQAYYIK